MKTKTLPAKDMRGNCLTIDGNGNFHRSGSISGMKRQFYGMGAKLIRWGAYIYNCRTPRAIALYDSLP